MGATVSAEVTVRYGQSFEESKYEALWYMKPGVEDWGCFTGHGVVSALEFISEYHWTFITRSITQKGKFMYI